MCVGGGGGGVGGGEVIFDPLTFTTLWANSADDNLYVFKNYRSFTFLINQ